MHRSLRTWTCAGLLLGAVSLAVAAGAGDGDEREPAVGSKAVARGPLGRQIPNFFLPDADGVLRALSDYGDKRFVVVVFMGTQCPIGNLYLPVLMDLQDRYAEPG